MPRNLTTGVFTRVSNSFSNPVYGTVIDPTDADALFDDYDGGLTFNDSEPLILVGSTSGALTILAPDTASGTITLPAGTTDFSATGGAGQVVKQASAGGPFTVGTVPASEIASPQNLTRVDDTNVTLTLGGTPTGALLQPVSITAGWSGTLAAGRLNSNVVQAITNDTNVTGSIAAQNLTLGWTGTLAAGRLNANVVQSVVNDTNVTGSISTQALTLGWTGTLANARLANMAAYTLKGNFTGSAAAPQDSTIGALTLKSSPGASDQVLIADASASGQLKYTTVSAIGSAGSVASFNSLTGAVTTSIVIQVFAASGTYTPTSGMLHAIIECVGGGGGGGGASASAGNQATGGGGGAGSYSRKLVSAADVGASKTVTIGAAGAGGTSGANAGSAGGDTSVGTLCIGKGGSGGGAGVGSTTTVGAAGVGGVAGTGDVTISGAGGDTGGAASIVTIAIGAPGGAGSYFGGAAPGGGASTTGANASGYGSGGGGASAYQSNQAGGSASPGYVIITEFVNL